MAVERVGDDLENGLLQLVGSTCTWGARGTPPSRARRDARGIGSETAGSSSSISRDRLSEVGWNGAGALKAQQVADAPVEPVHFLDDGVEVLGARGGGGVPPHELGGGTEARERVPEP